MMGVSHHFLLWRMKSHSSPSIPRDPSSAWEAKSLLSLLCLPSPLPAMMTPDLKTA